MRPISRLPHAPNFLLGMIDVRGSGYPIVDLSTSSVCRADAADEATRIIILDVPMKDRLVGVGFVADCVFEVTDIDEQAIEPIPDGRRQMAVRLRRRHRPQGREIRRHLRLAKLMANDGPEGRATASARLNFNRALQAKTASTTRMIMRLTVKAKLASAFGVVILLSRSPARRQT